MNYKQFANDTVQSLSDNISILQLFIKNPENDFDDRWEVYSIIQPYLKRLSYYWTPPSLENMQREISWFDDFYVEKYEVVDMDNDFIKQVENKIEQDDWLVDIHQLKEDIMSWGYGSFKMDW